MAKKSTKAQRNTHNRPIRRRMSILPYFIMALLIIGIPLGIYQLYISNVDRTVEGLTMAIKTEDMAYLEEKTDRLPMILDVFKKSYSEDQNKQNEFYSNSFENLEIKVIDESKKQMGKEVKVEVTNVNYIDVYDLVDDESDEDMIHRQYMELLASPTSPKHTYEASIYLKRRFNGYEIYETREFINAILGGALSYAEGNEGEFDPPKDTMDSAIDNN